MAWAIWRLPLLMSKSFGLWSNPWPPRASTWASERVPSGALAWAATLGTRPRS